MDSDSSDTSEYGDKAVQIVRPDPDKASYCVNREQLENVFGQESVANVPGASYSVAGAFRKGKSFILNFFLDCLKTVDEDKVSIRWAYCVFQNHPDFEDC